jgi:hypothetical protein
MSFPDVFVGVVMMHGINAKKSTFPTYPVAQAKGENAHSKENGHHPGLLPEMCGPAIRYPGSGYSGCR